MKANLVGLKNKRELANVAMCMINWPMVKMFPFLTLRTDCRLNSLNEGLN